MLLLHPFLTSQQLVPALVVFRALYYLGPFLLALDPPARSTSSVSGTRVSPALASCSVRFAEQLTPKVLSALTFIAGLMLLLSGAIPASPARLRWLEQLLPLAVVETSHFLGSVAGAVLLVLSQGLSRRLDAAYYFAVVTIAGGIVASLLKGFDVEEAMLLVGVLLVLWRARPAFYRPCRVPRYALLSRTGCGDRSPRWAPRSGWACSPISTWPTPTSCGGSSRSTPTRRAISGLRWAPRCVMLIFGVARQVAPAPHEVQLPDDAELDAARRVIAAQSSTMPCLMYLRDKALLFNDDRTGFVMYGVEGRTWAALGDPVGPPGRHQRSHSALPRTLRRLRGHASLLRGHERLFASLRRLRSDVRQAGRTGVSRSPRVLARRLARGEVPAGRSTASRRRAARSA